MLAQLVSAPYMQVTDPRPIMQHILTTRLGFSEEVDWCERASRVSERTAKVVHAQFGHVPTLMEYSHLDFSWYRHLFNAVRTSKEGLHDATTLSKAWTTSLVTAYRFLESRMSSVAPRMNWNPTLDAMLHLEYFRSWQESDKYSRKIEQLLKK